MTDASKMALNRRKMMDCFVCLREWKATCPCTRSEAAQVGGFRSSSLSTYEHLQEEEETDDDMMIAGLVNLLSACLRHVSVDSSSSHAPLPWRSRLRVQLFSKRDFQFYHHAAARLLNRIWKLLFVSCPVTASLLATVSRLEQAPWQFSSHRWICASLIACWTLAVDHSCSVIEGRC